MTKTNDCSAELAQLKERLLEAEAHLLSLLSLDVLIFRLAERHDMLTFYGHL